MRLLQKEHLLIFQFTLSDPRSRAPVTAIARFQSTLPERGETLLPFSPARRGEVFQSTLPAWGETPATGERSKGRKHFNPLSPHGERHLRRGKYPSPLFISIHSPRMGRDNFGQNSPATRKRFQSTLPAWGETLGRHRNRPSRYGFQSTLPAWGETLISWQPLNLVLISIHSPRMGRDTRMACNGERLAVFQSTLPAWGETELSDLLLNLLGNVKRVSPHGERRRSCYGN